MKLVTRNPLSASVVCFAVFSVLCALALQFSSAFAQTSYDALTVAPTTVARVGITMSITAGPSGAPGGFTVCWMKLDDFLACGSDWEYADSIGVCMHGSFTGTPTKHTEGGTILSYVLGSSETVTMEIGDLFDETGVDANNTDELQPNVSYVMSAYANEFAGQVESQRSTTYQRTTDERTDCLFTQGYWKNHSSAWPVTILQLGSVTYDQTQLLAILNTPAQGNGLIFLAHQLIATKLNIAAGASGVAIASTVAAADLLIGSLVVPPVGSGYLAPSSASGLTNTMDDYNNGLLGSDPCQPVPVQSGTWGQIKVRYF